MYTMRYLQPLCHPLHLGVFVLLFFNLFSSGESAARNVAMGKETSSSSLDSSSTGAATAVDGAKYCTYVSGDEFQCYFSLASPGLPQWWLVNLGDLFYITHVKVFSGYPDEALTEVSVLLSEDSQGANPLPSSSNWFAAYYNDGVQDIATSIQPARLSKYVAVYSRASRLCLNEVEVYGYNISVFKPEKVLIKEVTGGCVVLSWEPPDRNQNVVTEYQFQCTGLAFVSTGRNTTVTQCGFQTNTIIECTIRVQGSSEAVTVVLDPDGISTTTTAGTSTTTCGAPSPPSDLTHRYPERQPNINGRTRWIYNFTWSAPTDRRCSSLRVPNPYEVRIGSGPWTGLATQSYTYYEDGDVSFTLDVRVYDREGSSSSVISRTVLTPPLPPQIRPTNFAVSFQSATCVQLSWSPPLYINGAVTSYQYNCTGGLWRDTESGNTRTALLCGLLPYEEVTCEIRAVNAVGHSESASVSGRAQCGEPQFQGNLSNYITEIRSRSDDCKRRVGISLHIPPTSISPNCAVVNTDSIKWGIDNLSYVNNGESIWNLTAVTEYMIKVQAKNNEDMLGSASFSITTGELEPCDGPRIDKVSFNMSCVVVMWSPPTQPNGIISHYQYKCYAELPGEIFWTEIPSQARNTLTSCSFQAGDLVTCKLKARTAIGYGPETIQAVRLACGTPSEVIPEIVNVTYFDHDTSQERVALEVTWQPSTPYCELISYYNVTVLLTDRVIEHDQYLGEELVNVTDLEPYRNYTVEVVAVNNAGKLSVGRKTIQTQQLAPYIPPSLDINTNSTCVRLMFQQLSHANGVITSYQYRCKSSSRRSDEAWESADGSIQAVCGFRSAEKINCETRAVNAAGASPVISKTVYTQVKASVSREMRLMSSAGPSVSITVYSANLEQSRAQISTYVLVVHRLETRDRKKRTMPAPLECNQSKSKLTDYHESVRLNQPCYITAELNATLVAGVGYTVQVGEGSMIGGYYNAPLLLDSSYTLYYGVKVIPEDNDNHTYLVFYLESISFTATEPKCPSAPLIKNAELIGGISDSNVNDTIIVSCNEGFERSGDSVLTCGWVREQMELGWIGVVPECRTLEKETDGWVIPTVVSIAVVCVVLVIGFLVLFNIRKRRVTRNPTTGPEQETEYADPSDYAEIRFSSMKSLSDLETEYEEVTDSGTNGKSSEVPYYANKSMFDPYYLVAEPVTGREACQSSDRMNGADVRASTHTYLGMDEKTNGE